MKIIIHTDGACSGNPGPGGYGIVMQLEGTNYVKEFSQGYKKTTNNRMELMAVIVALEKISKENLEVHIYTDSKYVHDAIEKKWVFNWQRKHFKGKKNEDLWRRFLLIYPKHKVNSHWVKGHAGHTLNERADQLATNAIQQPNLLEDVIETTTEKLF
jgi:ribonuclease HI